MKNRENRGEERRRSKLREKMEKRGNKGRSEKVGVGSFQNFETMKKWDNEDAAEETSWLARLIACALVTAVKQGCCKLYIHFWSDRIDPKYKDVCKVFNISVNYFTKKTNTIFFITKRSLLT